MFFAGSPICFADDLHERGGALVLLTASQFSRQGPFVSLPVRRLSVVPASRQIPCFAEKIKTAYHRKKNAPEGGVAACLGKSATPGTAATFYNCV